MTVAPAGAAAAAPISPAPRTPSGPRFGAILEARSSRAAAPSPTGGPVPLATAALRGLHGVARAQERLDGLLAAARSGRTFTAQELMSLQGEAYRFSQTVELSAKLVEQGAQAVKQALHAQV